MDYSHLPLPSPPPLRCLPACLPELHVSSHSSQLDLHKDRTLLVVDKYEVTIRYFKVPEDYAKIKRNTNLWREKIVATVEYDTSRDEISTVDLLKEVTEWSGRDGS